MGTLANEQKRKGNGRKGRERLAGLRRYTDQKGKGYRLNRLGTKRTFLRKDKEELRHILIGSRKLNQIIQPEMPP